MDLTRTNTAWGDTACRADAADLRVEDTHIMPVILLAFAQDLPIRIEVNDTLKTPGDVCAITAIYLVK